MLLFSDVLYMLVRYASPSSHMGLRCLTISGPVGLLFLLCFIATWTVVSVMLVVCSVSVFLSMCLFVLGVTVLANCLLNAFAICVGQVTVFSLKVIVLFLGVLVFCWQIRVLSSKECVCCDPSVCLSVPSICLICVFV